MEYNLERSQHGDRENSWEKTALILVRADGGGAGKKLTFSGNTQKGKDTTKLQ